MEVFILFCHFYVHFFACQMTSPELQMVKIDLADTISFCCFCCFENRFNSRMNIKSIEHLCSFLSIIYCSIKAYKCVCIYIHCIALSEFCKLYRYTGFVCIMHAYNRIPLQQQTANSFIQGKQKSFATRLKIKIILL